MQTIDARCGDKTCSGNIYRMVSRPCINCGAGPFLILYTAGHGARSMDCPTCGNYWKVEADRLATDEEIPAPAPTRKEP